MFNVGDVVENQGYRGTVIKTRLWVANELHVTVRFVGDRAYNITFAVSSQRRICQ